MKKLLWIGCISYFLTGSAHVVVGAVLPELLAHYGLQYKDGGLLVFLQFAGFLLGVAAAPRLVGAFGNRALLAASFAALVLAESLYSLLPPWGVVLIFAPIAGFGFGTIEALIGAMTIAFMQERKAVTMGMLEMFFGIGALCMPLIAGVWIKLGLWHISFVFVAGLAAVMLLLVAVKPLGVPNQRRQGVGAVEAAPRYTRPQLALVGWSAAFFALYVGLEMSLVNFLPPIAIDTLELDPAAAAIGVTCFWAAMTAGRAYCGVLADHWGRRRYLLAHCGAGLVFMALLGLAGSLSSYYAAASALGLALSGLFGIALVFANEQAPGNEQRTTSLLVASGGIGGAFLPLFTGWWMDRFQAEAAPPMLTIIAAAVLLIMLLLSVLSLKARQMGAE
jgi:FHS family glucose/mannose:H+ symporter-like MFS transporter